MYRDEKYSFSLALAMKIEDMYEQYEIQH